ncbi:MAG: DUF3810 domain-containing protein [Chitinophagaceae bacterium]
MQQLIARIFSRLMKSWSWVLLIVLTILIKWASWYPGWVEVNYSLKIYPVISRIQRVLFGWLPISIGDLFYAFLVIIVTFKLFRLTKAIIRKKTNRLYWVAGLQQFIFFILFLYVSFNLLWGLNYNRLGIAHQLKLDVKNYSNADLNTLASVIQSRVNYYAGFVEQDERDSFNRKKTLFASATDAYKEVAKKFQFLKYYSESIKPSIYSYLGNYLGFQGYYNPFSGEAQVNTTIPRFLEPFVTTHEIAHQLGYARENEANFVGFLACRAYESNIFRYSVYFDMYNYTIIELYQRDSVLAKSYQEKRHPVLIKDVNEYRAFFKRYANPLQDIIMEGYGEFLKANNQPAGKKSYNEVVAWMIAYYKKYGIDAL